MEEFNDIQKSNAKQILHSIVSGRIIRVEEIPDII
jgi:hypothetical protein